MKNLLKVILLAILACALGMQMEKPCRLKKFNAGYVCVCTDQYCDSLNLPKLSNRNEWMLVTSSESGQRFNYSLGTFQSSNKTEQSNKREAIVEINQNIAYQEILGFGGSVTGAVTYVLNKLSKNLRECIYKSYYTNDFGLGYTLLRIPIGGCDFDLEPWTYAEHPENDDKLSNFTELHAKDVLRMEMIKECFNATKNYEIKFVGVAWSPPKWMKTDYNWSGMNDNRLKRGYYQTWADYHLKWLDVMHAAKLPIWAISTGNEPYFARNTPFIGLSWNASDQALWIAQHLGPTLKKSKHSAVQLHAFDDNRNVLEQWLNEMNASDSNALDFISAFAVHGYLDFLSLPSVLDIAKANYSDKSILYTEMCFGVTGPVSHIGPTLGCWTYLEELLNKLIEILMHNVNGYIDWNIILDAHGGPNYIENVVDAFMIANENFTEIYKQPLFYAIAHFSKFIPPGSKRIEVNATGDGIDDLSSIAFLASDGHVSVIFYNKHPKNVIYINIIDTSSRRVTIDIQPKSLNTLFYMI